MGHFYINSDTKNKDRYDMSKFMNFTDNYDPLTSKFFNELVKAKPSASYQVQNEENRPDLISKNLFGDFQFWWVVLLYNKVKNVSSLSAGDGIKSVDLSDIEKILLSMRV